MSGKQSENRNGSRFMYLQNGRRDGAPGSAFTFTELLAVLGIISSLALIVRAIADLDIGRFASTAGR
ncbi:MAG: hypothetical protein DME22_21905 [Verrucomicrobia bacterium]|nr:MAG: hypothetical protein DME22_21905 [Verrucomicrobiota bacterium]PYK02241.1 MAG: hypothetical protein DME23_02130 [Verrucomicrobiota bacterium]